MTMRFRWHLICAKVMRSQSSAACVSVSVQMTVAQGAAVPHRNKFIAWRIRLILAEPDSVTYRRNRVQSSVSHRRLT